MQIHFYLRYSTQPGESFSIRLDDGRLLPLEYVNDVYWHAATEVTAKTLLPLGYQYIFHDGSGRDKQEADPGRSVPAERLKGGNVVVFDYFNPVGLVENTFATQPFRNIFFKEKGDAQLKNPARFTHIFRAQAPLLNPGEVLCLLGHGVALRQWDVQAPILMSCNGGWWETRIDLSGENFPLGYKYGVWNVQSNRFMGFEDGGNRSIYAPPSLQPGEMGLAIHHDNFARLPYSPWRGAGVAIPVFSLRSANSFGVGEFADLPVLADWAKSVGLRLIQLLPVNDTTAKGTWEDSYPYSAISAFALHPIFLNVAEVAGKAQAALLKPYAAKQKELNALPAVDYDAVIQTKWAIIRQLFAAQKAEFLMNTEFIRYFTENRHWLVPYAAFCYLRDKNGTADFNRWTSHQAYREKEIEKLVSPKNAHYDEVAIHYFVQWHLHRQLKAAADYLHEQGLALKGDIPIGIYRYSCDAWVAPELYQMDMQAGAPPDDFAVNGQNWGFPTYNWARMKADGFAWWRQRFTQMSLYFDAFRIDHILGFFRIWSIPMDTVEGILGHFVPALPVGEQEFHQAGIGFNYARFCQPFINDAVLWELFGDNAGAVCAQFFDRLPEGSASQYAFKPAFDTQRKVETFFAGLASAPDAGVQAAAAGKKSGRSARAKAGPPSANPAFAPGVEKGLFSLRANVILIDISPANATEKQYAFRIGMENTASFRYLPAGVKEPIKALYVNYFFQRQDEFWRQEAMEKLPDLKRSTNMLICGEDLGMVPHCVPDVMRELSILSLEIQRMPKKTGYTFFHPKDAPYLAVVTPSTHDMSTLRGWWEEDRTLTQRFYNEMLGQWGEAPWYCEPWINRAIVAQHLNAPAMWAIFQLQDLMGMDGDLRRENPHDERINVPANPKHYWRYRMHHTLEELQKAKGFNAGLRSLVRESGR